MELPLINILFISDAQKTWTKEIAFKLYSYRESLTFNYSYIDDFTQLTLNTLNKISPQVIIVDLDINNDKFDTIFKEYRQIKYNKPPIIVGLFKECTSDKTEFFINNGFSAIFQKCTQNDETYFLTRFIADNFKNSALTKGLYAVAKVKKPIKINNFVNFTKLSFGSISFESICNFDAKNLININNYFISKFNWNGELNELKGKFLKTLNPLNCFTYEYSVSPISKEELKIKKNENKQNPIYEASKEILIIDALEKKRQQILLEKKHNLQNFYRKNKHDFLKERKINILSISNNIEIKLQLNNTDVFNLFKQSHLYINNLIKKIQPKIIFYEIEPLPKFIDEPTQMIITAQDKPYIYNNILSLSELLKINFHSPEPSRIIIFNKDTSLNEKDVMKEINQHSENYIWIDSELNDLYLNKILKDLTKTFKNEEENEELIKNKIKNEILYINKNSKNCLGFITHLGVLDSITEEEVVITTDQSLPEGKAIFIDYPIPMFVYIMPDPKRYSKTYRGIIMGINSKQRDALRSFVITYENKFII
jgi:hypothetical protein